MPPLLWGKSGHLQTVLYGKMGRVSTPTPRGVRKFLPMQDGATATFDLFEALADHSSGGKVWRWDGDVTGLSRTADHDIPIMHQGLSVTRMKSCFVLTHDSSLLRCVCFLFVCQMTSPW